MAGLASGAKVSFAAATQTATTAALLNDGTADSLTVALTGSNAASTVSTLVTTGFETVNFTTANTATTPTAQAHIVTTLTDATAKTITVTGNAGLTLGTFSGTALTSFDASGVTLGGVSYTTGVLAAGAPLTGGAGDDTLNAAASTATAGVTINGGAGADTITGSATKASTLNGGADNDSITGGSAADTIDGGTGTNTYVFSSANVVEQAGTSTTSGVVINLGSTALTQSSVNTATALFLATVSPSVAAGTSTYLFNAESSTNASVIDTLANIQNVTGSDLADYIVGSDAANTITGGTGADVMTGGTGIDTFAYVAGATGTPSATIFDTITDYATGTDKIDFTAGALTLVAEGTIGVAQAAISATGLASFNAADDTLAERIIAVEAAMTAATAVARETAVFVFGTDSYIFVSDGTAGLGANDVLIKLTGIAAATGITLTAGDITAVA